MSRILRVLCLWLMGVWGTPAGALFSQAPTLVHQWGTSGEEGGQFHSPICLAINREDQLFVADVNNARIQQFDLKGNFIRQIDLPRDDPNRKSCLIGGMAFTLDGNLTLAYMIQHKVGVYTLTGERLYEWGTQGSAPGQFQQPGGILVLKSGNILVADQCNHRLQEFTETGEFVRQYGSHGSDPGEFGAPEPAGSRFGGPHFVASDSFGRIYTSEGVSGRIQQFSAEGEPLNAWGSKTKEPGAFGEYQFGNLKNSFGPIGVFVDSANRVWVSSLNDRVQGFSVDGSFLFGLDVGEAGSFAHPHGMAEDRHGFLYIADSGNQRILKFKLPPR